MGGDHVRDTGDVDWRLEPARRGEAPDGPVRKRVTGANVMEPTGSLRDRPFLFLGGGGCLRARVLA